MLDAPSGSAATRKLLRSVFYKGLAAAVLEALWAAEAAGEEAWMREHLAAEIDAADRSLVRRLEEGSHRHRAGGPTRWRRLANCWSSSE